MTAIDEIIQSPIFARQKKKLHPQQIKDLDEAVAAIAKDGSIGVPTAGDLQGVHVYRFKCLKQKLLLAYEVIDTSLYLYAFGAHENFYRDLKKNLSRAETRSRRERPRQRLRGLPRQRRGCLLGVDG